MRYGDLGPHKTMQRTCDDLYVGYEAMLGECRNTELVYARMMICNRLSAMGYNVSQIARMINKCRDAVRWHLGTHHMERKRK